MVGTVLVEGLGFLGLFLGGLGFRVYRVYRVEGFMNFGWGSELAALNSSSWYGEGKPGQDVECRSRDRDV